MTKGIVIILVCAVLARPLCAVSSGPDWFDTGVAQLKRGDYAAAVTSFSMAAEQDPDSADIFKNRGVAYMKQGRYTAAIADFKVAVRLDPDMTGLFSNLGTAFFYTKAYPEAIENYTREIERSPSYFAYFNRAICLAEMKAYPKSLEDIDRALAKAGDDRSDLYQVLCLKADVLVKMGNMDRARTVYTRAAGLDPAKAYARKKLAGISVLPVISFSLVPERPLLEATGTKCWELQAGAFRSQTFAQALADRLNRQGYDVRLLRITTAENNTWHVVRVGKFSSYTRALAGEKAFEQQVRMDAMVKVAIRL